MLHNTYGEKCRKMGDPLSSAQKQIQFPNLLTFQKDEKATSKKELGYSMRLKPFTTFLSA